MKIVITGAKGQLGLEIVNQLDNLNNIREKNIYDIVPTDRSNLNITDLENVNNFIFKEMPDVVINCAAYTKVDLCENDIDNAYKVNALGVRNLATACEKIKAKFVQISTDYVFDGNSNIPYKEDCITFPNSIYGKSKLMGEYFTRQFSSKYFIIRTAWLYGDGDNFVRTMLNLAKNNNEINVVDDQIGSPTSTVELAEAIINLIETDYYGIYHGTCEGECSWYEFANKIFELSKITVKVNPITSNEFKREAPRPMYSVLDNFMLKLIGLNNFNRWDEALKKYLE
ncbi:TPA: dTDP-4-dehydrorhamnose reductase [Clostridioides difficile]|nr:dTDP-4-dehydrorhamnose reductase [Clostridioides difficile]AXU28898.1 dtdp-4-dehydrorhamnose reductase [Clostridioides difficile]AXU32686.1 dtdp-4-dehydrorhamnose reductase [Clostridioides difficile]AXU36474.1 dtdp-4-dehydrorhamnose reductase [Clostridioides difficile]EGT3660191.1 dTDP-4-dehydrorhamnose reductase [Clostridioides difficile]EGT4545609.1 dTDP-4-dehydrorhamnose reductase [Clostridioides difficile]